MSFGPAFTMKRIRPVLMRGRDRATPCAGTPPSFPTSTRGKAVLSQHHGYARHDSITFPIIHVLVFAVSKHPNALPFLSSPSLSTIVFRGVHVDPRLVFESLILSIQHSYLPLLSITTFTSGLLCWLQSSCRISLNLTFSPLRHLHMERSRHPIKRTILLLHTLTPTL